MFAWRAFPSRGGSSTGPAEQAGPGAFLTVPSLLDAGIRVAFTTRHGGASSEPFGSLNLSFVSGDDPAIVTANRSRALAAIGATVDSWCGARQVHGSSVVHATAAERGRGARSAETTIPDADALWTDEPGVAVAVLTADCVPILLADPEARRIAVVHAGWRGLVAGVVEAAVAAMGGAPVAFVGPAIGPCCYEVGPEVSGAAREALGDEVIVANGSVHLDLWRGARIALMRAGVGRTHSAVLCTRCETSRFYSHRAGDAGRQGVIAMLERR